MKFLVTFCCLFAFLFQSCKSGIDSKSAMNQAEQQQDQKVLDSLRQNSKESSNQYPTSNNASKEQRTTNDTTTDLSRYKVKRYHLSTVTNSGKTIPVGILPTLEVCSEKANIQIEFCKEDIRFKLHNDNIILDSIIVREVPWESIQLWSLTESDKEKFFLLDSCHIDGKLVKSVKELKHKGNICDTFTIHAKHLVDIPLLPEMAFVSLKLYNKAVIADKTSKQSLLNLLKKEGWLEVQFFSKSIFNGNSTTTFKSEHFSEVYETYLHKAKHAPEYKKIFAIKHHLPIITTPTLREISIPSNPNDSTRSKARVELDGLSGSDTGKATFVKRKTVKRVSRPGQPGMRGLRSRANIMRTVRQGMASLKYAFNRRLKSRQDLKGKVVVKWSIDEQGNVVDCSIESSTLKDPTFEQEIISKMKSWTFGTISIQGDVTTVTFPFTFGY